MPTAPTHALPADAADEPQYAAYRQLMEHTRVREFLEMRVKARELPRSDGEDLVGQAFEALWRRRTDEDPADNLPRMVALARTVLEGKLVDYFRHKAVVQARIKDAPMPRGEQLEPGQCSGRDQLNYVEELRPRRTITPEMTLQAKQQMAFVNAVAVKVGLTDADVETMQAIDSDEMTIEQAAELRGMTEGALRVRLHRIRKRINKAWDKFNLIRSPTLLMLLILLALVIYAVAMAGARRNDPPPQQPPQRTLVPRQPRGEAPTDLVAPPDESKTSPR